MILGSIEREAKRMMLNRKHAKLPFEYEIVIGS